MKKVVCKIKEKEDKILAVVSATVVNVEGKPQMHCEIHGKKQWVMSALIELLKPVKDDLLELIKDAKDSGISE